MNITHCAGASASILTRLIDCNPGGLVASRAAQDAASIATNRSNQQEQPTMPKLYHNGQAWQVPGQQDKDAERVNVPSSPPELAAWLNAIAASPWQGGEAPRDLVSQLADRRNPELEQHIAKQSEQTRAHELEEARRKAASAAAALERDSAEHIAAWIFDQASPAQVEQLFAALGTRFHEQRSK